MNSIELLRGAVLRKAREEAERIVASARESAKRILEEARERKRAVVEAERSRVLSELDYEARVAEAKVRARILVSKARHEVVSRAISKALELLESLPPEVRLASLRNLLEEAVEEVERSLGRASGLVVYVSERDAQLARGAADEVARLRGVELELRTTGISGGVVVEDREGRVRVDNSYDSRISALASRLSRGFMGETVL